MQRRRVLDAMAYVLAERGLLASNLGLVLTRAGVPRSTFRELFKDLEDCLLALLEHAMTRSTAVMIEAFERETAWPDAVLAGLEALLVFLDSEPVLAKVWLLEMLSGSHVALERRARLLEPLQPLMDRGREHLPVEQQPPPVTAEATIACVAGILKLRLVSGRASPFTDLLGELVGLVVAPYLGAIAAAGEVERGNARARALAARPPVCAPTGEVQIPKELRHASAYRLRACLAYVAQNPGASNQQIACGIDLSHHGQMSYALARLRELGLLVKQAGGAGRPNAWWLSSQGEEVQRALDRR